MDRRKNLLSLVFVLLAAFVFTCVWIALQSARMDTAEFGPGMPSSAAPEAILSWEEAERLLIHNEAYISRGTDETVLRRADIVTLPVGEYYLFYLLPSTAPVFGLELSSSKADYLQNNSFAIPPPEGMYETDPPEPSDGPICLFYVGRLGGDILGTNSPGESSVAPLPMG